MLKFIFYMTLFFLVQINFNSMYDIEQKNNQTNHSNSILPISPFFLEEQQSINFKVNLFNIL